jgi:serine/threonine protein kinase
MGKRKIAMRDIKPDNLLVAGDFEGDPLLLASAENYTIGLIDVETAVDFETAGISKPGQPQLGGTPLYATPSHFFNNELLNDVYGDLPKIFHLQDWYAVIGIIYELVTGEHLFVKTANKVHEIIQTLRVSNEIKSPLKEIYRDISRIFWQTAEEEYNTKIHEAKTQLGALRTEIPENIKQWFKPYLIRKKEEIYNREKACIDSQTVFKNEKECRRLLRYSHKDITRLKAKYEKLNQSNKKPSVKSFKVNQLLDDLILMKKESFRLSAKLASLEKVTPSLSADVVLEAMFGVVVNNMYKKQWETIPSDHTEADSVEIQDLFVAPDQDPSALGYTFTV